MEDDSEYGDGDIVWVKLSYCWWPGEVYAGERLTEEFLSTLKRRPLAVVKFFDEDTYEFVKNANFIFKYNCHRKHEFLRKGLEQYRAKNKHMEKFPSDVMHAERATGGDPNIVNSTDFLPQKRESYSEIFQPDSGGKARGKGKIVTTPRTNKNALSPSKGIPVIPVRKHEVRILGQASSSTGISIGSRGSISSAIYSPTQSPLARSMPSSANSSAVSLGTPLSTNSLLDSSTSPSQFYHCHKCGFESSRQNVIVLHTKYCRAVPMVSPKIPTVKAPKMLSVEKEPVVESVTPNQEEQDEEPAIDKEEPEAAIQAVEPKSSRGQTSRTPRLATPTVSSTSKTDRRRMRGRGRQTAAATVEYDSDIVEEPKEVNEETGLDEATIAKLKQTTDDSQEEKSDKDPKNAKSDVELKNELLADWSEDEQDDPDGAMKDDRRSRKAAAVDDVDKSITERALPVTNQLDVSLEKSAESSPQLASPASSGNTIKYRNIPKKQKREFIEVTNDQPALPAAAIEKSSSESSISTAAAGGEVPPNQADKTSSPIESSVERPISAKQRILDRATRGSSKSLSGDEMKVESPGKLADGNESQPTEEDDSRKETSCFDFNDEEEEEEVVLNKSPRRSLSNRRDTSLEAAKDHDDQERSKKYAELNSEIETLLCETSLPTLPELPVAPRASSPVPSSSTETTPQSKEEIDRNRTLPPKERGKRIFKTRNKIIENEAIALEQSKAIVMDFVKKSHEDELAELRQQQEAEAKQSSASPTTTNDDSQESVASIEAAARFENSEFAAIKAKRAKFSKSDIVSTVADENMTPQESAVSSSNEANNIEPTKAPSEADQPESAETLEKSPGTPVSASKGGRKGKQRKSAVPVEVAEATVEPQPEAESLEPAMAVTPKPRRKRTTELNSLDLTALDTPRSRRGKTPKSEESSNKSPFEKEQLVESEGFERQRKSKKSKKEEKEADLIRTLEKSPSPVAVPPIEEKPKPEQKTAKSRHSRSPHQQNADSTADVVQETTVPVVDKETAPVSEVEPTNKQQPIKMIIKSKGKKSNAELICESVNDTSEPKEEEVKEKLPKSPKSSKRKKSFTEDPPLPMQVDPPLVEEITLVKAVKSKRPKFRNEAAKLIDESPVEKTGPSATDLQIAEALINLPEATPSLAIAVEQEAPTVKSNSGSPVLSAAANSGSKSINPRKRHLHTLMNSAEVTEQPKVVESLCIPEKKKRDAIELITVAPVVIASDSAAAPKVHDASSDEDKFDIDNIPIVMDGSELLEDATISTTTNTAGIMKTQLVSQVPTDVPTEEHSNDDVTLISTTKPMTKKIVIVKNSNGSTIEREVPKKHPGIKSTTIVIKPPLDQLSPKAVRSPTHSPPIRSAQLIQASGGGQIVITSKGTVLTTQSPVTSSAKIHLTASSKNQTSPRSSIVQSVSSVATISSSISSKSLSPSAKSAASPKNSSAAANKTPANICVQSQEIIHPVTKARIPSKETDSIVVQKSDVVLQKVPASASPPKKAIMKKLSDSSSSSGKPLFSTSKGAPITPQPATSSAVNPGKKGHRVIKISPQKLKEFTRLGMVEDKGQGKVLTASGMKKFRQEQQLLQQQQQQQQKSKPVESKKLPRTISVDEEPSTSTPTPPPPNETSSEVVVAAAADSSVKEIPLRSPQTEEQADLALASTSTQSVEKPSSPSAEENEADATVKETDSESSTSRTKPNDSATAVDPIASSPAPAAETPAPAEVVETSSNVQESSQLIAVPAENFGGPANLFYLCSVREEGFVPVNNELLYLDSSNQLVALPEQASVEDIVNQAEILEIPAGSEQATVVTAPGDAECAVEAGQQNILLNTQDGQQIILDQQSLMALAAGGDTSQLLTPDGQQILLQGSAQELLAALSVSQPGLGIVAAEGTQIIVAPESLIDLQVDAPLPGEIIQVNPNTTVETNAVLTKPPIMSTAEVPTKNGNGSDVSSGSPEQKILEPTSTNLDESLAAVIGVPGNPNVPTSLELPITVTNPVIAKTTTSKINPIYPPTTAISAVDIDSAVVAAAVVELSSVAQTGTDSHPVEPPPLETNTSDEKKANIDEQPLDEQIAREKPAETNGKNADECDVSREDHPDDDLDEIIPNTPESQMNSHAEMSSQFSDDESEAAVPIPNVSDDDEDDRGSNCSEIIPLQPNVVVLRDINNELVNNNDNDNSSDMELDNTNPASGNQENNPNNQSTDSQATIYDSTNSSTVVER